MLIFGFVQEQANLVDCRLAFNVAHWNLDRAVLPNFVSTRHFFVGGGFSSFRLSSH
jgi:hypothetical protein